jgi:hypothetical protein
MPRISRGSARLIPCPAPSPMCRRWDA